MRSQPAPMSAMTSGSRKPSAMPKRGSRPPGLGACSGSGVTGAWGLVFVGSASGVGWLGGGVGVGGSVGARLGGSGGVLGSQAVASSSSAASRLRLRTEPVSNAFWGEVQERRHPRVQDFAVFWLSRQQMLVVDQASLFLDPLVPAVLAHAVHDERPPLARQWRPGECLLTQAATLADHFLRHMGSLPVYAARQAIMIAWPGWRMRHPASPLIERGSIKERQSSDWGSAGRSARCR